MAIKEEFGLSLFGFDVIVPVRTVTHTSKTRTVTGTGTETRPESSLRSRNDNNNNDHINNVNGDSVDGEQGMISECECACGDSAVEEGTRSLNKIKYSKKVINERTPYFFKDTDTISNGNGNSDSPCNINRRCHGFEDHKNTNNGISNGFSAAEIRQSTLTEMREKSYCKSDFRLYEECVENIQSKSTMQFGVELVEEKEEGQGCGQLRTEDRIESNQANGKIPHLPGNLESCAHSDPRTASTVWSDTKIKDMQHVQILLKNEISVSGDNIVMNPDYEVNDKDKDEGKEGENEANQSEEKNEVYKGEEGDFELVVIDVNYFPSYKEVPDFPRRLRKFLRQKAGMAVYS